MSNCRWTQVDQVCSRSASCCGAPSTVAMVSEGYGRAHRGDKVARAVRLDLYPQLLKEAAHHRTPAVGRARCEGRPDQCPQPPVLVPREVQDVGVDMVC